MLFRSDHTGSAPPEFSPSNLQLQISVSVFLGFCGAPSRERRGIIFIGVFRSKRSRWRKDRRQWSSEAHLEGSHAARYRGRVGPPLCDLRPPFACILRSEVFLLQKKMVPVTFQLIMTSLRPLKYERKNTG